MKRLYIVRHAKSDWGDSDLPDINRKLNKRGKRDAPMMGERLKTRGAKPDLILTSPARRAISTAKRIAEVIGYPKKEILVDDVIYGGRVQDLVGRMNALDNELDSVMIFGHNPYFTMLSEHLTGQSVGSMPTCSIFCVDFDHPSWAHAGSGTGSLVFFDYPKNSQ